MKKIFLFVAILVAFTITNAMAGAPDTATIRASIHGGVEWLAQQQNSDGSWGTNPNYKVATTALAVKKLEHHCVDTKYGLGLASPFDPACPYCDTIIKGFSYIFANAKGTPIRVQHHDAEIDTPDTDGDGRGVWFYGGGKATYTTGIALMAVAESRAPDRIVDVPGSVVDGWTYYDVAEDVMNSLAMMQTDEGWGRGGWDYTGNDNSGPRSDGSNTGYAVLGLQYAEAAPPEGFGIAIPDFVKRELNLWINTIQCNDGSIKDGGGGYDDYDGILPCGRCTNTLETGNILKEMEFCGSFYSPSPGNGEDPAICFLVRHWNDLDDGCSWWVHGWRGAPGEIPNYQAMYTMTKGLVANGYVNPAVIACGDTIVHWQDDFDSAIVATQNADSSWGPCCHGDKILCTAWALLTLQKIVPPPPEVDNKVIIPNKVYERFGFSHWDYFPWDSAGAPYDNYIILDDACPPYNGINPGDFFEIPIVLDGFVQHPIGGFELEVEFDYIDLTFYGAMRGCLLSMRWYEPTVPPPIDSTLWSWEYFTYRLLPCTVPHKYKILLFGQADMPDGPLRRGYCLTGDGQFDGDPSTWWYVDSTDAGEEIGATLAWLKFQVANNELLRDLKLPIFFEWEHKLYPDSMAIWEDWDCAENTFSSCDGNDLYVSKDPLQFNPDVCSDTAQNPPLTILEFVDGGVHVCSPCTSFKCVRGDINLDHITYTTADAVLFARYFVEGLVVFVEDMPAQVCATDVNADGRTLMLADLIYLIRVILRDAPEIPKLAPSSEVVKVIVYDNTITTECASPIGAILFEFDAAVVPTLLATNMEMVNKDNKVLVWSRKGESFATAEVLSFVGEAELVSVTAVDYDTRELTTSITGKVAPISFALNPAYPNPFNPFTNLSFTLPEAANYSLKIYNVAGQLVRGYEGMGVTGLNLITWDGKDNAGDEVASGVYFYRLSAGDFSATKKMVVLK